MNWAEQRTAHWFVTGWAEQFAETLCAAVGEVTAITPTLTPGVPHPEVWEAWQDPLWCSVSTNTPEGPSLLIGCALDTAKGLTGGTATADSPVDSVLEAHAKLIEQTLAALAPAIESKTGRSVQFTAAQKASPPEEPNLGIEYQIQLGGTVHLLVLAPNSAFVERILSAEPSGIPPAPDSSKGLHVGNGVEPDSEAPPVSHNLKVLMDVDLDLAVSFGKTEMPLEEVLKLASGSIVELNRSANDPVDVLVNNSVVARGEVVVVDGNYGIRVTEVVSQKERIRSVM